ncbi:hypothetical protein F6A13_10945 [Acidithiobacillus sp. 'AMD consortium']|jgi:hypothetical protein|uniref:Uncharacterized protein n=1 Tax=Acidithiobacillus ferrooxidans (strain ATCC 23270 / DSM 14882 / CIP 104768 / NCIMB 8455) TaxID=243159 RepID=B7J6Z8_ACIF2|nr:MULTISPECIES: hypothetical protein [Acidithiobacillus]ACH84296.1 hypothetical protein Lferr_2085 [Acidithiobacillus ferrooxidans ATCC 53993]ACK79659.1 hypothetical protein AFE_2461 [Acidithiobacillus ferrooxidans ATCC 23270]MBN6744918.1 hypothetical protein [Acidithiobacillus sp. MC2.2]MBN6747864.1 hypothetical protein [Acidithiobacillus sp. PG05]MBU2773506.1 hypothetical protein [Acidithiobacillus ferrooxidans]
MSAPSLVGDLAEGVFVLGGIFLLWYRIGGIASKLRRERARKAGYDWALTHPGCAFQLAISAGQERYSKVACPLPSMQLYAFLEGYHDARQDQQQIIGTR